MLWGWGAGGVVLVMSQFKWKLPGPNVVPSPTLTGNKRIQQLLWYVITNTHCDYQPGMHTTALLVLHVIMGFSKDAKERLFRF